MGVEKFKKATLALGNALSSEKTKLNRDASIRRFVLCVDLGLATAKRTMAIVPSAPKLVVKQMAEKKIIKETSLWLKAVDQRNLSSYAYNEKLAEEVYDFAREFLPYARQLVGELEVQ